MLKKDDAGKIIREISCTKDRIVKGGQHAKNEIRKTKYVLNPDSPDVFQIFYSKRTELISKIEQCLFKKKFKKSMELCFSENIEESDSLS